MVKLLLESTSELGGRRACRQSSRVRLSGPMQSERHELLEVRLGSGKVYLVPRALLENLVQALPVSAPQLIVSASTSGAPLDPSGLRSFGVN